MHALQEIHPKLGQVKEQNLLWTLTNLGVNLKQCKFIYDLPLSALGTFCVVCLFRVIVLLLSKVDPSQANVSKVDDIKIRCLPLSKYLSRF